MASSNIIDKIALYVDAINANAPFDPEGLEPFVASVRKSVNTASQKAIKVSDIINIIDERNRLISCLDTVTRKKTLQ